MRVLIGGLVAATLVWAAPAQAADPATLGCVSTELGTGYPRDLSDLVYKTLAGGATNLPTFPSEALDKAIAACTAQHGWSNSAGKIARAVTLAGILGDGVRQVLPTEGVDVAAVARVYASMDETSRRGFIGDDTTLKASAMVAAGMLAKAKVDVSGKRAPHVGMLLAALAATEFFTPLFATA